MKLLIAGAAGQLGSAFVSELAKYQPLHNDKNSQISFTACNRNELDITNPGQVERVISQQQPDFVINTAAYTQVDLAEVEQEKAYAINQAGPANLAQICERLSIPLIHFSTDCVFDGRKKTAWVEQDATEPVSVYGASKLAGEQAVQQLCDKHLILRVSWVFSEFGRNFVRTMLQLGATHQQLRVVDDQFGKPTCAHEIVRVVLQILKTTPGRWGIYHLAQPEPISWHGFAEAIFAQARASDQSGSPLVVKNVLAVPTSGYPTAAQRPANSVLNTTKLEQTFGVELTGWRQSLAATLSALGSEVEQKQGQELGQNNE